MCLKSVFLQGLDLSQIPFYNVVHVVSAYQGLPKFYSNSEKSLSDFILSPEPTK
jgi:hypothetical protein